MCSAVGGPYVAGAGVDDGCVDGGILIVMRGTTERRIGSSSS